MGSVFLNSLQQKQFEEKGFVIIPSVLNNTEINSLIEIFNKHKDQYHGFFYTSHFSTDVDYKKLVHDAIATTVFPKVSSYLNDFVPLFGNFMIKNPDAKNAMDLHADWTYVEEPAFHSVSIWIPLVDVNETNGCLGIIEGTHKMLNAIRGPLILQSSRQQDNSWVKKYGKLLPMKAGDAILYDHALLHYSPPNKTDKIRPAINLSATPRNAEWIHYCKPEGANEIEKYSVPNTDFFIHYNHFQKPKTDTLLKTLSTDEIKLIDEKMNRFWKDRMIKRMKRLFVQ